MSYTTDAAKTLAKSQTRNWPTYRSFKDVKAAMIMEIPEYAPNQEVGKIVVAVDDYIYDVVINPAKLFARGLAKPGDYYVVYEDGYDSWSPKDTFEKGYLLLQSDPKDILSLNATKQEWNFIRSVIQEYASYNNDGSLLNFKSEEEREAIESFLRKTERCQSTLQREGSKDNV